MVPEAADLSPWRAVPDPIAWTLHCHFAFNSSKGPNTTQKHSSLPSQFAAAALHYCMSQLSQHPRIPHPLPSWKCVTVHRVPAFAHSTCAEQMRWEGMLKAGKQQEDLRLGTIFLFLFWLVWGAFVVHFLFGDFLLFLIPSREVAYKTWQTQARHQQEL